MLTSIIFYARWFVLPQFTCPGFATFVSILPMFISAGYYLSFFFIISHNFVGVQIIDNTKDEFKNMSFLRKQVTTSSNVGGSWLCFMNGGLNYQIEHHLFPRIQHSHYPKIAPIVKDFCKSKGITYVHFPTISENISSCVKHLAYLGQEKSVAKRD